MSEQEVRPTGPAYTEPEATPAGTPEPPQGREEQGSRPSLLVRAWHAVAYGNVFVVTLLSVIVAMAFGAILIAVADPDTRSAATYFFASPWDTFSRAGSAIVNSYVALFHGAIFNPATASRGTLAGYLGPISETLVNATPLILAGLSVGLAFRAGLFNIGGQGQIIMGAVAAGYLGFAWHLPPVIHVIVAAVAGILGGAIWGGVAGFLKARTGAHEVISTIMLNYVAFNLLAYLLSVKGFQAPPYGQAISNPVDSSARLPGLLGGDLRVHTGLLIALAAAGGAWWLLTRSALGFELRAVGGNQFAARSAGMSVERSYTTVMVIAGALSGLAGVSQILGTNNAITQDIDAGFGFDAITVALLGRATPGGTVLAGLLFGALRAGGVQMQSATGTPIDVVQVVQALIVLFIAAPMLVRAIFRLRAARAGTGQALAKGWNG